MEILMVLTSLDQLGDTVRKTGVWAAGRRPPREAACRRRKAMNAD